MSARKAAAILALTYLLNLFDLHCTLWVLRFPGAWEWNPFCRWALTVPHLLEVYKYAIFPCFLCVLYRSRRLAVARAGVYISFGIFLANMLYQLVLVNILQ